MDKSSVIEFFEEDLSLAGLAKVRGALADAYPLDAEVIMSRIEWPRPVMVVESAVFRGLEIVLPTGDTVSRGIIRVGQE